MDPQVFIDIERSLYTDSVMLYKQKGWRFVNLCASSSEDQLELLATFYKEGAVENLSVVIPADAEMPSISTIYPNAFIFENEIRDLYGIHFEGVILDYEGKFYGPSVPTPMNPRSAQAEQYLTSAEHQEDEGCAEDSDAVGMGGNAGTDAANSESQGKGAHNG